MPQFMHFVANHWLLWTLLFVILVLIIQHELAHGGNNGARLSAQDAVNLINRDHAVIFDLRGEEAYKSGHIAEARNIPLEQIADSEKRLQKFKEKPVLLVCDNGQAALKAEKTLRKLGFSQVKYLNGGIKAWQKDNLPLIKT